MKKQHLTFLLIIFYISLSFSQDRKIEFGIKLGANYTISSVSEKGPVKFDNKIGGNFGVFINYNISNKVKIRPELIYSIQNLDYEANLFNVIDSSTELKKGTQKESYINIPLLLKYNFTENFSFLFGPQVGFIINSDDRFIFENEVIIFDKAKDNLNLSGNLGLSLKINEKIETELRYNFGLTELNGFKNSVLQLNFGYTIW